MSRTEMALQAGKIEFYSMGTLTNAKEELIHVMERFLLALDDKTFAALIRSLEAQSGKR